MRCAGRKAPTIMLIYNTSWDHIHKNGTLSTTKKREMPKDIKQKIRVKGRRQIKEEPEQNKVKRKFI